MAAKGVKVAIFDLDQAGGERCAAEIGGIFCKVNITRDDEVDAAFAKARAAHGQERVLMNCAGMGAIAKTVTRDKQTGPSRISRWWNSKIPYKSILSAPSAAL